MNIPLSWVAAAIVGAVAAPAFAASSASASFGPLNIQLFDLNPMDGVTPWIAFTDAGSGYESYVYAYTYQSTSSAGDSQGAYGATPWAPVAVNATAGGALASASISGSINGNGSGLSASGSSADFSTPNYYDIAQYGAGAHAPSIQSGLFTLSANTVAVISGAAQVAAAATWNNNYNNPYSGDYAQGNVSLNISGTGGGGGGSQSAADGIDVGGYTNYTDHQFSHADSRTLAVSFVNLTNGDLGGSLQVRANANGYTYASAVPEPETYALMLAGLAAIGLLARRRRG